MSDAPRYVLSGIPNDVVGRAIVKQMRKYCNYDRYNIRVRGSGPRAAPAKELGLRKGAFAQSIPLSKAATLRVYIEDKQPEFSWAERRLMQHEIETLTRNVRDLQLVQQTLQYDAHLAYSRGYETMVKKVAAWIEGMPWLLRKALIHFYKEV